MYTKYVYTINPNSIAMQLACLQCTFLGNFLGISCGSSEKSGVGTYLPYFITMFILHLLEVYMKKPFCFFRSLKNVPPFVENYIFKNICPFKAFVLCRTFNISLFIFVSVRLFDYFSLSMFRNEISYVINYVVSN